MGFQMVLDDSGGADGSQQAESSSSSSSSFPSCLSSLDAEQAFVLVQEALAKRQGAARVRTPACLAHWLQAQLLMPHSAADLSTDLVSHYPWHHIALPVSPALSHCFSLPGLHPPSQLLPSGELFLCLLLLPAIRSLPPCSPNCWFVLFPCPLLAGPKGRALCHQELCQCPAAAAQPAGGQVQEAAAEP